MRRAGRAASGCTRSSRPGESGASLAGMRLTLSFAGFFALAAAAAACASNEPNPPEPQGNVAPPDTAPTTAPPDPTAPQAKTCEYGGKTRAVGESFPSTDGCNTCSCTDTGNVACTEKACAPSAACNPDKEPNREYKMRSPADCKAALFRCDTGKKPFFNDCGCGCE